MEALQVDVAVIEEGLRTALRDLNKKQGTKMSAKPDAAHANVGKAA